MKISILSTAKAIFTFIAFFSFSLASQASTLERGSKNCGGFQGMVADKSNYNIKLAGATIQFLSEDGTFVKTAHSSSMEDTVLNYPQGVIR